MKKLWRGSSSSSSMVVLLMALVLTCAFTIPSASAESKYIVGGSKDSGWKPGINYTEWANKFHFYVGDWLYFGFDKTMFNVLEVNQTDYNACVSEHPIMNVSKGAGRDIFQFTEARPYYFLSSGGYCFNGMKLAVIVEPLLIYTPPAPAPSNSGSSLGFSSCGAAIVVVAWMLMFVF